MSKNETPLVISIDHDPVKLEFKITGGVVYLVGPNAAGKSRILDAIKSGQCKIVRQVVGDDIAVPYAYVPWGVFDYDPKSSTHQNFKEENSTLSLFDHREIEIREEIQKSEKVFENNLFKRTDKIDEVPYLGNTRFVGYNIFSGGVSKYHRTFRWELPQIEKWIAWINGDRINPATNPPELLILGLEEPEANLHPNFQKSIPLAIDEWINRKRRAKRSSILVIVTTHSPFVLKGVSETRADHQVFCLKQCSFVDPKNEKRIDGVALGMGAGQAMIVANRLLGAGLGDLFPSPILIAEGSVERLLRGLHEKIAGDFNYVVINPNGDGDGSIRSGNLQNMIKMLKRVAGSRPESHLFGLHLICVADGASKLTQLLGVSDALNNDQDLKVSGESLGEQQLEDSYPQDLIDSFLNEKFSGKSSWKKDIPINDYFRDVVGVKGQQLGAIKCEFADYIAANISDAQELKEKLPRVYGFFERLYAKER